MHRLIVSVALVYNRNYINRRFSFINSTSFIRSYYYFIVHLSAMATQPLLHYLSIPLPTIGQQDTVPGRNTTNPRYGPDDISEIVPWPEFSYDTIIHRYGAVLNQQQIRPDPFDSPPRPTETNLCSVLDAATWSLIGSDAPFARLFNSWVRSSMHFASPR